MSSDNKEVINVDINADTLFVRIQYVMKQSADTCVLC